MSLVADLSAENPIIRFLAVEKLSVAMLDQKNKEIPKDYSPNVLPEKQESAIGKWKQAVPPGWVPE